MDRRGIRDFLNVPRLIYQDDPHWIAPLDFEQKQRFDPNNPFFLHARWQAWVAYRGDQPVGRISAQVDDLHQQRYQDDTGYFGLIEAGDDADLFARLFAAAEGWLREQGMRRVRGPYNLGVNEEVGLLVDGFDTPPFIMMGHGKPWYDTRVVEQAYVPAQDMLAYMLDTRFEPPEIMLRLAERVSDKVTIRPLRRKHLAEEAEIMRNIFNDAWQNNWGFVPFTAEEYGALVKTLTLLLPDEYVQIVEYEGEPAAFVVVLPNINEASRDLNGKLLPFGWVKLLWRLKVVGVKSARVPLMGVRQKFQNSRLGPTMAFMGVDAVRRAGLELGVERAEMGWILESNAGIRNIIETIGGVAYKRYRMYEKTLS
ncbi:N-acetyltransferase [Halieaceae bacterium IMCC14734]|uniref:N-acetyltransferase n=1 Tax=Candidatus Litorirhabdus singularis TaxID=2518993 RepID=A0ABT3TJE4_9GAMM|nr:N-acetyltransferase [Candidatus Litorirhabdus singularis]